MGHLSGTGPVRELFSQETEEERRAAAAETLAAAVRSRPDATAEQLVDAAIVEGRVREEGREQWLASSRSDPEGTRQLLTASAAEGGLGAYRGPSHAVQSAAAAARLTGATVASAPASTVGSDAGTGLFDHGETRRVR